MTVIFPLDDEMTTINCGGDPPADQYPPAWSVRGIKNRLGPVISYDPIYQYDGSRIDRRRFERKEKSCGGLVEQAFIPTTFTKYLTDHLPGAEFVDATEWVDEIKVIKSPEEIELIKGRRSFKTGRSIT